MNLFDMGGGKEGGMSIHKLLLPPPLTQIRKEIPFKYIINVKYLINKAPNHYNFFV